MAGLLGIGIFGTQLRPLRLPKPDGGNADIPASTVAVDTYTPSGKAHDAGIEKAAPNGIENINRFVEASITDLAKSQNIVKNLKKLKVMSEEYFRCDQKREDLEEEIKGKPESVSNKKKTAEIHSLALRIGKLIDKTKQIFDSLKEKGVLTKKFAEENIIEKYDVELKKYNEKRDSIAFELALMIDALGPTEEKDAIILLRADFYDSIHREKFDEANDLLFFRGVMGQEALFLPVSDEEKALLRKLTSHAMHELSRNFKNDFIDSKKYIFGWEDGYSLIDGRVPSGKLSCISFVFEYMRTVLNTGEIQKVGDKLAVRMYEKNAALDLSLMFGAGFSPAEEYPAKSNDDIKKLRSSMLKNFFNNNEAVFYACQAYGRTGVENGKEIIGPSHAFVVASLFDDVENEWQLLALESNPPCPRAILLDEKLAGNKYDKIDIRSVVPEDPEGQLVLLLNGIRGQNLPKGKSASKDY